MCVKMGVLRVVISALGNLVEFAPTYGGDEIDKKYRVQEGEAYMHFNGRLMNREMKMEALNMMMKASMVVLIMCFIGTILMFTMK
ncbi:unnamed protein product [Camellia sinensis]